ncbi:hypothetical protein [Algihabitans albus]|uniref:hypothetical protein n=1 Tax=Algihabitans albus TaxID=2164067 RepID=UPI000E5D2D94|nr:hypothetical protein [Algihabitans albus]
MPREQRTIFFSEFEVIDALRRFVEASKWDLGDNIIERVQAFDEQPVRAVALCGTGEAARKVNLTEIDLARAFMLYCVEREIPIPKRGQKDVRIAEGALALTITVND